MDYRPSWSPPHLRMRQGASASSPQRLGWKIREKAEAFTTEPATGKGDQGDLGELPSRGTSDVRSWQAEQRTAQSPRHLTVANESTVAPHRKAPAARTDRTGTVPVTSVHNGELCKLHLRRLTIFARISSAAWDGGEWPRRPNVGVVENVHRVALETKSLAVRSATSRTGPAAQPRAVRIKGLVA